VKEILEAIKLIFEIEKFEFVHSNFKNKFTKKKSFNEIKRMIYGIWHNGGDEYGHSILVHMPEITQKFYRKIIKIYSITPEIKINFCNLTTN